LYLIGVKYNGKQEKKEKRRMLAQEEIKKQTKLLCTLNHVSDVL